MDVNRLAIVGGDVDRAPHPYKGLAALQGERDVVRRDLLVHVELRQLQCDPWFGFRPPIHPAGHGVARRRARAALVLGAVRPTSAPAIVQQASGMIQAGQRGTFVTQLDQPWAATPQLNLSVRVADRSPVPGSARVIFEEGFFSLPGPLDDAEAEVVKVLQDEQKIQQALAMPTILLVNAALTGMSVFRPMNVWAQRLNVLLPTDTPFVGIAVMMPELISPDAPLALVTRPGIDSATLAAVKKLAADLGLGEVA